MDELTAALINQEMITELIKPQEAYGHTLMKQLIEDIAQCSIMRLDPVSMDRLWDLVTMVFKWQVTLSNDIIGITARHLYEIETFSTKPDTQLQLHRVQNLIDNFNKILTKDEKNILRDSILAWLQDFNVRISLLLRLGFQNQDGSFKKENFNQLYVKMLDNIGENIYEATKNFNLSRAPKMIVEKEPDKTKLELNLMINQILGEDNRNKTINDSQIFRLSMCENYEDSECGNSNEKIDNKRFYSDISISNTTDQIKDIFDDLSLNDDENVSDLQEELLNILDDEC